MISAIDVFNGHSGYKLTVRIGVDTGAVVGGATGKRTFLYDFRGDVANTASRMQSHGAAGRIHAADSTR